MKWPCKLENAIKVTFILIAYIRFHSFIMYKVIHSKFLCFKNLHGRKHHNIQNLEEIY